VFFALVDVIWPPAVVGVRAGGSAARQSPTTGRVHPTILKVQTMVTFFHQINNEIKL
jgi:hypothetical protein